MPRISVITVCKNSGTTIEDALRSVASQCYRDYEHIVIDGASTDSTISILGGWKEHDIIWRSEPDRGIYNAMNKGIEIATGEVIGFLNSDDVYAHADVLGDIARAFEDDAVEVSYGDLQYVSCDDPARVVRYWKSGHYSEGAFARGWCPAHPTFYVRRSVFEQYGRFDERYLLASDAELMMRLLAIEQVRYRYVPEVWVKMRTGGRTNKSWKNVFLQNREIVEALKKHRLYVSLWSFAANKLSSRLEQRWMAVSSGRSSDRVVRQ